MEIAPELWPTIITFAIVIPAIVVASFASVGLVHGLSALRAMRGHHNAPSLRLVALNLLEPSVMIILSIAFLGLPYALPFASENNFVWSSENIFVWSMVAVILQSLMLLAPSFALPTLPFRDTIATWGRLRWINAVLLWAVVYLLYSSAGEFQNVGYILLASGIVILWLSINKILSILRKLLTVEQPELTLEP